MQKKRTRHPEKQRRPDNPAKRKPSWIRVKAPVSDGYLETKAIVAEHGLSTVCEEAACPNIGECWAKKHATFMIMGDICTRACAFCNVSTGKPGLLDPFEPARTGAAVSKLGLVVGVRLCAAAKVAGRQCYLCRFTAACAAL